MYSCRLVCLAAQSTVLPTAFLCGRPLGLLLGLLIPAVTAPTPVPTPDPATTPAPATVSPPPAPDMAPPLAPAMTSAPAPAPAQVEYEATSNTHADREVEEVLLPWRLQLRREVVPEVQLYLRQQL